MSGWYLGLLWSLCGVVFVTDWLFRRVPNRLLIAVIVGYVAIRLADAAGVSVGAAVPLSESLTGAVLAFIFLLPFYAFRAMGAGDVKCFAVMGLLLGPLGAGWVWLIGSALTGIHALILVCAAGGMPGLVGQLGVKVAALGKEVDGLTAWIRNKRGGRRGLPYAAYMAVAALGQLYWINAKV